MSIIIREARPEDAAKMIAYVNALLEEPESFLELSKGEFTLTVGEEMRFLENCWISPNSIFIVAADDGKIVGQLLCNGSRRAKVRHSVVLGMSVDQKYRDKGIGSMLMEYAIEWAKGTSIVKRIELYVFKTNKRAIHLYEKYGFVIEGEKQKAIKINGEYINEYIMALMV
ncbi:MAG TPA: GNAT family N-acetyltransferase [Balneolales bacterium]|nr:GNAT family N-acetyltransferase [Balneolales bacterium]